MTEPNLVTPRPNAARVPSPTERERDPGTLLDRPIAFASVGWFGIATIVTLATAFLLRFVLLNAYTLTREEAEWAYDAWSFYVGKPLPGGESLPLVGPLFVILESFVFFLFGVTDAIARALPALAGIGIIALVLGLRPFFERSAIIGMMVLAAISPTLLFASRTVDPAILVAFFALLAIVSVLRSGLRRDTRGWGWSAMFGIAIAGMFASGPAGISAIIAVGVALLAGSMSNGNGRQSAHNVVRNGLATIARDRSSVLALVGAFVGTMVLAFTRWLSDPGAIEGVLTTFGDWGRMMATRSSATPTQFFLYATLLYELLAVAFAIVAMSSSRREGATGHGSAPVQPTMLLAWFVTALLLQSFAAGRQLEHTVLVALPLVLLGGVGLGRMADRIPWSSLTTSRAGLVPVAALGLVIGLLAVTTLIARSNDPAPATPGGAPSWAVQIAFVLLVVVVPLGVLLGREFFTGRGGRYVGWSLLLVLAAILGLYTVRSATELSYHRAESGNELLAPGATTDGIRAFVNQTLRLSRDLSLTDPSNIDNTGSYGISIALDPAVEWPYLWYFREFPDVRVTTPAGWDDADMVIAPSPEGMEEAGYIVQSRAWENRVPPAYEDLDIRDIASVIASPSRWYAGIRYLLYRDLPETVPSEQVAIGYTFQLSNQLNPSQGPFNLFQGASLGPGSALGQFDTPTGIALSNDGETVYIVDSGNRRIQRFAEDGEFIGVWSAETDPRLGLGFADNTGQGASDIIVSDDDLIYVADTWNHRVLVLDSGGQIVRELGMSGELTDIENSPDPSPEPGLFFGPRSVAIADGEIYVTDTGNERVQVFASDGTFLRAFGGYGSEPGKLLEPVGIAIGPDGNVWVADSGNNRISVFTPGGDPVTQIPVPAWEAQGELLNYLRFGTDGRLYATSPGDGSVSVVESGQPPAIAWEGDGGDVQRPLGIAVAADGSLFLTDPTQNTVGSVIPDLAEGTASPVASPAQ